MTTRVWSLVPEAMFVKAQAASNYQHYCVSSTQTSKFIHCSFSLSCLPEGARAEIAETRRTLALHPRGSRLRSVDIVPWTTAFEISK